MIRNIAPKHQSTTLFYFTPKLAKKSASGSGAFLVLLIVRVGSPGELRVDPGAAKDSLTPLCAAGGSIEACSDGDDTEPFIL